MWSSAWQGETTPSKRSSPPKLRRPAWLARSVTALWEVCASPCITRSPSKPFKLSLPSCRNSSAPAGEIRGLKRAGDNTHGHARDGRSVPPRRLLDGQPMRPRRPGFERGVEINLKPGVQRQVFVPHARDVNLVVTLGVYFSKVVLVQEIVADHQPFLIRRQHQVMRSGVWS